MICSKRGCLNINLVNIAVDSIVFKVDSRLGILIPRKVDESFHRDDNTGCEVWCRVLDTFVDRPKDEREVTGIQKRIVPVIIRVEARIGA